MGMELRTSRYNYHCIMECYCLLRSHHDLTLTASVGSAACSVAMTPFPELQRLKRASHPI